MHILVSFFIFSMNCWLFRIMLFSLYTFAFLIVSSPCGRHLILLYCDQKRCLKWFQFFFNLLRCDLWPRITMTMQNLWDSVKAMLRGRFIILQAYLKKQEKNQINNRTLHPTWASLVAQRLKRLPPMQETQVQSLGQEDPLEKEMVTHSSILAWRIPWMEKPGRLQSTGSQRVGHDWVTSPSPYT